MLKFFKELLSTSNKASSKRFAALFTLLNVIILAYIATFKSKDGITPEFMYDSLCLIAGGGLGLTILETIFNKKPTGDIKDTEEGPKE